MKKILARLKTDRLYVKFVEFITLKEFLNFNINTSIRMTSILYRKPIAVQILIHVFF